ncbi:MAG: hypothetical protein EA353_10760 [Puniceicoccaceae bacterium]|nr:MAG: hypothetical protein EA353_10760 [Puniceicoccaceae bacterium]
MNWRECRDQTEREQIIRLTCEPMEGRIQLIWGLETLRCPPECEQLRAYAIETKTDITGCAMAWDWPGAQRYLNGLRFGRAMPGRPRPHFWKTAFESLLDGADYGWTSIGLKNKRARKILESGVSWLPQYKPRQMISTWFVPLPRVQAHAPASPALDQSLGITPLDWRHVAIAAGSGLAYRCGRALHRMGRPGIPAPGHRIRVGDYRPPPEASPRKIQKDLAEVKGYDGLIIVLPDDSRAASIWRKAAPKLAWAWQSMLYTVAWQRSTALPPVPAWKGFWL